MQRRFLPFAGAVLIAVAGFAASAGAQTVYLPVQYQFGRYGELFYGGNNPAFLANPFLFAPEAPRNAFSLAGAGNGYAVGLPSPYTPAIYPLTQVLGAPSPSLRPEAYHVPYSLTAPQIFTDLAPYADESRRGFTINDARNEAYLNIPRYQVGSPETTAMPEAASPAATTPAAGPSPAHKAAILLSWARNVQAKGNNPQLVEALLREAARYDPAAAARMRAGFTHQKP